MKSILILLISSQCFANVSIEGMIRREAALQGVDPIVALAVAKTESNFDQRAVGPVGEIGVFQLRPRLIGDYKKMLNLKYNIKEGVRQLKWWAENCPIEDKSIFWVCFNNGFRKPKYPTLLPYYKRVTLAMEQFDVR